MRKAIKYLLVSTFILSFVEIGYSIPQFAKKYGVTCFTCHATVPKLNAFGHAFRRNGFQLPGTMDPTPVWQQEVLPLSGMPHPMYMRRNITNNMLTSTTNGIPSGKTLHVDTFNSAFELYSGGTAGDHLSYLAFLTIHVDPEIEAGGEEGGDDHGDSGSSGSNVASIGTHLGTEFHQFFIVYNNLFSNSNTGKMNVRLGFFHLDLPFMRLRKLTTEMSPNLVYNVMPVNGGFNLDRRQLGVSAFGGLGSMKLRLDYEVAIVNGTNNLLDTNEDKDLFIRAAINRNDRLRVGMLYYKGNQNIGGGSNLSVTIDSFTRFGYDVTYNLPRGASVFGQWLEGKDDDIDWVISGDQPFEFTGGFIGTEFPLSVFSPQNRLLRKIWLAGKYDFVNVSKQIVTGDMMVDNMLATNTGNQNEIKMYTATLRYYFQPNVFLIVEKGFQDNLIGYPPLDDMTDGAASGAAGRVLDVDADWFMLMFVLAF